MPHAWKNPSSEEELRLVSELSPPLVFETILETYFGLARDGKSTKQGIPKNPLQIAVLADESRDVLRQSGTDRRPGRIIGAPRLAGVGRQAAQVQSPLSGVQRPGGATAEGG